MSDQYFIWAATFLHLAILHTAFEIDTHVISKAHTFMFRFGISKDHMHGEIYPTASEIQFKFHTPGTFVTNK